MKPTLYALIAGIGAYEQVRPLRGPVADAEAVARYLRQLPGFTPNLLLLTDRQATKTALIEGFQQHLAQAGPNDTVLFYFAGHGTQEQADTDLWITETDGKLECLVCFDGDADQIHDFLLADKELRYLIGPLSATGAHIVTIFDCCNSGDNTRAFDLLATALDGHDVRERRLPEPAPRRPYEGFFFHQSLPAEQLKAQGVAVAIPEGTHVQMAACESDESAVEVNAEGMFTKHLLQVLEAAHGQLTYGDLHNRVRQYMRFAYEQRPRVYSPDGTDLMSRGFLNQAVDPDTLAASATFNPRQGWLLDVGAIHGVSQDTGAIALFDAANQRLGEATPERVGPDYTVLKLPDDLANQLDKTAVYQATIAGLLSRPIRLHLANHGGPTTDLPTLLQPADKPGQPSLTNGIVIPEDDESRADYTLHTRNGLYYLAHPSINTPPAPRTITNPLNHWIASPVITNSLNNFRPLTRPLSADDPLALAYLTDDLRHVAKWEYLRQLRNPAVSTPLVRIDLLPQTGTPVALTESHGPAIPISYIENNGVWSTTLTVTLTNPNDQPLYCTALYLSRDFMSYPDFLPTNYRLEPGQSMTLGRPDKKAPTGRQTSFRFKLEEVIRQYNWPHATEYIKLIATTAPLSEKTLAFLKLNPLPSPPVLADRLKPADTRGSIELDDEEVEPLPDWSTQTITFQLQNPLYNTVRSDELDQMLAPPPDGHEDLMADFALGLYYETDNSGPQPTLKLRDDIRIIPPAEGQRSLWTDLTVSVANVVARRVQNRQYRQNLVRYPDRIRIVAEGDSWFQYPFMLRDIVDYLSGVYSVFSVAAAGATLEDYLKNSEFLESIGQVKPQFFLLSGGGNDLLGEGFKTLLREAPDNGKTGPDRYLTDAFQTTLTAILDRYKRIFRLVHLGYPDVRVLVHGYDYVIPSGAEKLPGSSSWMGNLLTQRGITDPTEREAIAHHLIDGFNAGLREVATQYPNVTYLDLRGTVHRTNRLADYWYDEIHPNDKGFLSLSSKFVAEINKTAKAIGTRL